MLYRPIGKLPTENCTICSVTYDVNGLKIEGQVLLDIL